MRTSGRAIVWVLLLLALLAGAAWYYFNSGSLRINISQAEILERLNTKLPLTRTWFYVFEVTLDSPRVELIESSERINAGLDVAVEITLLNDPEPLRGKVDASAGVRYAAEDAAFYLQDPDIESLTIDGLPNELAERTSEVLAQGLASYFKTRPIYKLSERQSHRAAKAVLRDVKVRDNKLTLLLGPPTGSEQLLP